MTEPALRLVGGDQTPPSPRSASLTGRWLPVQVAADRAGLNVGALRRRIVEQDWPADGRARHVRQPSGHLGYEVDEGADARFAAVKTADTLTDTYRGAREFLGLPGAIRDRALQRETLVREWQGRVVAGRVVRLTEADVTRRFVLELKGRGVEASRASLFNWLKAMRTSGLAGLVDEWGKREEADITQFWHVGSESWLHPNKRSKQLCYEIAVSQAEQHGWERMSYRDFCRKLDAIPAVVRIKRREGEDAFVLKAEPSIQRDYTSIASNDWWCSDDHTLDVMATYEGRAIRPILHAWEDLRSRKIVAWAILPHAPRAGDVLRAFVGAVREHGVPNHVLIDNGKHFDSRALQGVTKQQRQRGQSPNDLTPAEAERMGGAFRVLGCHVTHARPHHGQSKPIERGFGTVCSRFSKLWESYTGNSPDNKPGKGLGTTATKKAIARGDVPTLAELTAAFGEWVANDYNARPHLGHGMDGRTPDAAYAAELETVRRVSDEVLEFATFERAGPFKVSKNGVSWRGLQYGWSHDALIRRLGREVLLAIDERDVSHVYVLDPDGSLVCRAEANARTPFGTDKRLLDSGHALKRRARKIAGEYQQARPHLTASVAEMAFVAAADRKTRRDAAASPAEPPPPPSVQPVRTAFDAQATLIQRAFEGRLRTAAGGEAMTGGFGYAAGTTADADTDVPAPNFVYRPRDREASDE